MTGVTLFFCTLGFAFLGLATDEHHGRRLGRRPSAQTRRRLRIGGWIALFTAFPPAIVAQGWIYGPVLWSGAMMAGAGVVFLALNLAPAPKAAANTSTKTGR